LKHFVIVPGRFSSHSRVNLCAANKFHPSIQNEEKGLDTMLRSMKTLGGALCFFASAFTFSGPAGADTGQSLPKAFIAGDFSKVGGASKGEASAKKRKTAKAGAVKTKGRKSSDYAKLVRKAAKKHGVPVKIAMAVVEVESNFNPRARGNAGEVGLMQIKPTTARGMGYRGSTKALYDPKTNLDWGMRYLAGAHKRASGDVCGTILRYNAGHYAKRMNPISRRYCKKVQRILSAT
jgi:hypothetical protein